MYALYGKPFEWSGRPARSESSRPFSIDRNFSDVLDALIVVDLTRTDPKILERYMGRDAAGAFIGYHRGISVENFA